METKARKESIRNYKYEKVLNEGGRLFYMKRCVHCNTLYKARRQNAVFCGERCRRAAQITRERLGATASGDE
ncbi:hypothetical protein GCM10028805_46100 [Spirosoma harenae]